MAIEVYKSVAELCQQVYFKLIELSQSQKKVTVSLSGGSTPKALFQLMAKSVEAGELNNVHFFWGDERLVDVEDAESNYGEAYRLFFKNSTIPDKNIWPAYETGLTNITDRYAQQMLDVCKVKKGVPRFDLIILGMGTDGHTASLFPDRPDLWETDEICSVVKHPESGQERITITGKVINAAYEAMFLCTGASKAEVVAEIITNEKCILPAAKVAAKQVTWCLDTEAAQALTKEK